MHSRRRGLTVLELLIILIIIAVAVAVIFRMRGENESAPSTEAVDSTLIAPPGAGNALATSFELLAPLDSTAATGDTITVRLRATTTTGTAVSRATVTFAVDSGGGTVAPPNSVTDDMGEVEARWTLGDSVGEQVLHASIDGGAAVTVRLRATAPTP